MSVFSRYFSKRRRRPTSASRPRRVWWSCLCSLRCSVRSEMRLVSIATWTSGEPVSPSTVAYSAMMDCLVAVSSATVPPVRWCAPQVFVTRAVRHTAGSPRRDRKTSSERLGSACDRARGLEQVVEEAQQLLGLERLGQEVVDALGPGLPGLAVVGGRSQHDDRQVPTGGGADALQDGVPVHARHHDVEDDAVRTQRLDRAQAGEAVLGGPYLVALELEHVLHQASYGWVVVDHQDLRHVRCPSLVERCIGSGRTHMLTRTGDS